MTIIRFASPLLVAALMLGGCSPGAPDGGGNAAVTDALIDSAGAPPKAPAATAAPTARPSATATVAPARVIGLDGLGPLRIGAPVPGGSGWAERGAQASDTCRTVTSPAYPGVYAIVSGGTVRRITVGQGSDVKLAEGIGVGAGETAVQGWFGGFRAEPHKYEEPPAKYLTAPNASRSDSALRFEIGHDGRVSLIHVGRMPELAYAEGCA